MDTVVYTIHNPKKYQVLIDAIVALENGKGQMKIPDKEKYVHAEGFRDAWFNKDLQLDYFYIMSYSVKANMPSSSAGIMVKYDDQKQYIKIEFSIPKYFFGNNVCEVLPSQESKYFRSDKKAMYDMANFWFKIISQLPQIIVNNLCEGAPFDLDPRDVQVSRIDITVNQIFDNCKEALHYLDSISRVSYPRLADNKKLTFDGTNMVVPAGNAYSFKVYHKGKEFTANGIPQIRKQMQWYQERGLLLPESNLSLCYNQLQNLQEYADRCLRYELTGRSKLMSQLFNRYIKKQNLLNERGNNVYWSMKRRVFYLMRPENLEILHHCKTYYRGRITGHVPRYTPDDADMENFIVEYFLPASVLAAQTKQGKEAEDQVTSFIMKKVESPKLIERIAKIKKTERYLKHKYNIYNLKTLKAVHKKLIAEDSASHQFMLDIGEADAANAKWMPNEWSEAEYDADYMKILEKTPTRQRFTVQLLKLLIYKHNQLFKVLQFQNLPMVKDLELKARAYNENIEKSLLEPGKKKPKKVNINRIKLIAELLKTHTWDSMRKTGCYDRTTIWRMKKDFCMVLCLDISTNLGQFFDLSHVARDTRDMYFRHFDEMMGYDSPLAIFLNNTPFLLLV